MENLLFIEKQQFRQAWLWVLLTLVCLLTLWGFIQQILLGIPWGDKPAPDGLLIFLTILPFAVLFLFAIMYLKTEITNEEIRITFFPFVERTINWDDVMDAYVRQYRPLAEFGGWGIRLGAKGMAYNVAGNKGLQLVLKNGKKVLVGTQLPEEMESVINIIRPFVR